MLLKMFVADFGDQLVYYATLVDPNNNQFETLVERINGIVYFRTKFYVIRDFYDVRQSGSLV
jgi:hypothetical protein